MFFDIILNTTDSITVAYAAGHRNIGLKPGTHDLTDQLVIDAPCVIRGADPESVTIEYSGATTGAINITSNDVTLEGFYLDAVTSGPASSVGIQFNTSRLTICNVDIYSKENCLESTTNAAEWEDLLIQNGIFTSDARAARIVSDTSYNVTNMIVEDCIFISDSSASLWVQAVTGTVWTGLTISGCHIQNGSSNRALVVYANDAVSMKGVTCTGNILTSTVTSGDAGIFGQNIDGGIVGTSVVEKKSGASSGTFTGGTISVAVRTI